jgi:hypothetical protein
VAFSFHSKDEALAQQLSDLLSDRLSTFIYSEQQKALAGRDGEEAFNAVFMSKARIVVVLHREEWGQTPFTRIEQTAIQNRAFNSGYDFTIFIPTDGNGVPRWVPKTRLYVGLDRWGVEGAAAVIESAVQREGGQVKPDTAAEQAARLQRSLSLRQAQEDFRSSFTGVQASRLGIKSLEDDLIAKVHAISSTSLPKLQFKKHSEFLILGGLGPWMTILWNAQHANILEDSYLRVELLSGPPRLPGLVVFDEPRILKSRRFYYELFATDRTGYVERGEGKPQFEPTELSDHLLKVYMDAAQNYSPRR